MNSEIRTSRISLNERPIQAEANFQKRTKKTQEKRKQWYANYCEHLSLKEIKSYIEEVEITKKSAERRPLSQYLEGVLIDESEKKLYLYLTGQKDKIWLHPYIYIKSNTIKKWESKRNCFENCQQDNPNWKAFPYHGQKGKQKKKCFQRHEEVDENFPAQSSNIQKEKFEEELDNDTSPREDEEEFGRRGLREDQELSDNEYSGQLSDEILSRLRKKQMNKALLKQMIALRPIDLKDEYVSLFYNQIGNGRKFKSLVQEYVQKKDGYVQQILHENMEKLKGWEREISTMNFENENTLDIFMKESEIERDNSLNHFQGQNTPLDIDGKNSNQRIYGEEGQDENPIFNHQGGDDGVKEKLLPIEESEPQIAEDRTLKEKKDKRELVLIEDCLSWRPYPKWCSLNIS